MYICMNCHEVFEEPNMVNTGVSYAGCYEQEYVSPCCGEDFKDAVRCKHCDEYFADDDLVMTGCCEGCLESAKGQFNKWLESSEIVLTPDEKAIIRQWIEEGE